jgi:hypothetical protein
MISNAIDCDEYRKPENPTEYWDERTAAMDTMVKGALQLAASRQLGQNTQERMGEREMMNGAHRLREIQQAENRKWAELQKASRAATPKDKRSRAQREKEIDEQVRNNLARARERDAIFANTREERAMEQLIRFGEGKTARLAAIASFGPRTAATFVERGYITMIGSDRCTLTPAGIAAWRRYREL